MADASSTAHASTEVLLLHAHELLVRLVRLLLLAEPDDELAVDEHTTPSWRCWWCTTGAAMWHTRCDTVAVAQGLPGPTA
jgi:hypothetical protein